MCRLVSSDFKNSDRVFYCKNAFGYIGSATAYYTDDFSFCYSVDSSIIIQDKAFKELLTLFDMLKLKFNSFHDLKKKCTISKRRLYSQKATTEYGFSYESDNFKFFARINPNQEEINFKIYVYKKEAVI